MFTERGMSNLGYAIIKAVFGENYIMSSLTIF